MGSEIAIMKTRVDFERDPELKLKYGSYENYMKTLITDLKRYSLMDCSKEMAERIRDSVKDWVTGKLVARNAAEEAYDASKAEYAVVKKSYTTALNELNTKKAQYADDPTKYSDELKKYNDSEKQLFTANLNEDLARDHLEMANSAYAKVSYMG